MSYVIYKTESIVLRVIPNGEANKDVVFLTRELGKITARAQSARKMESKMRMHLVRYRHVLIDLVRGKNTWRLTGVSEFRPHQLFSDNELVASFARATGLVEHLIRGEEFHPQLFDFFVGILDWVDGEIAAGRRSLPAALELFLVIHVLSKLGYWDGQSIPEIPNDEVLQSLLENKKQLVVQINDAIEATQIV